MFNSPFAPDKNETDGIMITTERRAMPGTRIHSFAELFTSALKRKTTAVTTQ